MAAKGAGVMRGDRHASWKLVCVIVAASTLAAAGVVAGRATAPAGTAGIVPAREARPTPNALAWDEFSPFRPLPLETEHDPRKVALGRRLFEEKRMSADATVSCASCHNLLRGGADAKRRSIGVGGAVGSLNAPTVLNCGFNFRQFWDGRAETLEEQVDGPLLRQDEMASHWSDVITMLQRDPSYAQQFASVYADGVTAANVRDAIATFERSLVTPNSRFDRYLRGATDVLDARELTGYRLFTELGCGSCHQGLNMGGNMFQVFGRVGNYFQDRGDVQTSDLGRFNVTGDERDRYKFKVPSLRNVALTAPYFHDGSAATLEEAVQIMARYQIGQELHRDEVESLVAFLNTLTGQLAK